jgi:biotin transport system substrate-specific component
MSAPNQTPLSNSKSSSINTWVGTSAPFVSPILGAIALAVLAQVRVTLPWTPVPITGQTFGVALMALLFGARVAGPAIALYVIAGALGAPVFSGGLGGLGSLGPTLGYLGGMVVASFVVGALADRGWARRFWTALGAAYVGSAITFACGLAVLSAYLPSEALLGAGLLPFLAGDAIKNTLAAGIASGVRGAR